MTNDDCRRIGLERCGTDVYCSLCERDLEVAEAEATLERPYFDIDGNEGTLDEVSA